jgi:N-methylhydantoinase B
MSTHNHASGSKFRVLPGGASAPQGSAQNGWRNPKRLAAKSSEEVIRQIDLDILGGKLACVVDEMASVLVQTSMSPVIHELLDFACSICDHDGQLIAQHNGVTVLTGTISSQLAALRTKFEATIRPGDVFISNDPYAGGTHTADITLISPVFFESDLVCFVTVTAHFNEVGGKVAGSLSPDSTEIFQEGLRISLLRIVREGIRQDELIEFIAGNVRLPEMTRADLTAQLAVVALGNARLRELCALHGVPYLYAGFERALEAAEALSRAAVGRLPNGEYFARDWIDGDGNNSERIPIQVRVTVRGDSIRADFTGSGAQRAAPINCTRGALEASVKTALLAVLRADDVFNDGWFRPLSVVAPDGTVFTATHPHPTGWCYEAGSHATDLMWKALAQAVPERLSAGSYTSLCVTYFGGRTRDGLGDFVLAESHVGGWGGACDADGASALIASPDGDTYNHSIELIESKYPIRIRRYALNTENTCGAGMYRGGLGIVREYEILADGIFFYSSLGRSETPPWGLEGGDAGGVNFVEILRADGTTLRSARIPIQTAKAGDIIRLATGNGGGYGDPFARSSVMVLADVRNGVIDAAEARRSYGVALSARDNETQLLIDPVATALLRSKGADAWGR